MCWAERAAACCLYPKPACHVYWPRWSSQCAHCRAVRVCVLVCAPCVVCVCAGMRVKLLQTVLAAAILMTLKEEIFLAVRTVLAGRKAAAAHKLH